MNIIPDTNIFIDFWKRPTESIKKIFDEEDVIICGPVRAELLQGALTLVRMIGSRWDRIFIC